MAALTSVDLVRVVRENLEQASPDLLRAMVNLRRGDDRRGRRTRSAGSVRAVSERVNRRNGYRDDLGYARGKHRAGNPEGRGQLFPTRQRHSEQALVSVVAISYLLGVSTRRLNKPSWLSTVGITSLSVRRSHRGQRAWMALSSCSRPSRR